MQQSEAIETIGRNIEAHVRKTRENLVEFARRANVSKTTVYNLCGHGDRESVRLATVERIAKAMEVPLYRLMLPDATEKVDYVVMMLSVFSELDKTHRHKVVLYAHEQLKLQNLGKNQNDLFD